jgi:uncharacterized protein YbjT (DUF2867 family)
LKIVLTGSLGNISKPLIIKLVAKGHSVTVISSKTEREREIEALGAKAAIGTIDNIEFLSQTFTGADVVYTMMALNAHTGAYFDQNFDIESEHRKMADNYAQAIQNSGATKVIHLSTIGAHTSTGVGLLNPHLHVEATLKQLPENVHIKFMRPVGFYYNMFAFIPVVKAANVIIQNYGGDEKEPWVSPLDIVEVIAEEIEKPFDGRTFHYIASDEVSPNEVAKVLGKAIGKPSLQWITIPDEQFLNNLLNVGISLQVAKSMTEMNASRVNGVLYEDYYKHRPILGKVKLTDFAKEFMIVYNAKEQF